MRKKICVRLIAAVMLVCGSCACSYAELPVALEDVQAAQDRVQDTAFETPLVEEDYFSRLCEARVFLKLESLQHTGSFKVRGAYNKIASLAPEERARGVIAASAGNHSQGVARAAKLFGIPATIVMPVTTPETKLEATKSFGAEVVLYGENFDESLARALAMQKETGATFVHAYDDPYTIAGQGVIGLEIMEALPETDIVFIPVGGGGLASGISVAIKGLNPSVRIYGVEPETVPSMTRAFERSGPHQVKVGDTLAEGTAVGKSGELTYTILRELLEGIITVSEDDISRAVYLLLMKDKVLTEGAGALGSAALLSGKVDVSGQNVVLIISGGNIDRSELVELLEREKE